MYVSSRQNIHIWCITLHVTVNYMMCNDTLNGQILCISGLYVDCVVFLLCDYKKSVLLRILKGTSTTKQVMEFLFFFMFKAGC